MHNQYYTEYEIGYFDSFIEVFIGVLQQIKNEYTGNALFKELAERSIIFLRNIQRNLNDNFIYDDLYLFCKWLILIYVKHNQFFKVFDEYLDDFYSYSVIPNKDLKISHLKEIFKTFPNYSESKADKVKSEIQSVGDILTNTDNETVISRLLSKSQQEEKTILKRKNIINSKFNSYLTEYQKTILYNELLSTFIDESTVYEEFESIFNREEIIEGRKIKWITGKGEIIFFFEKMQELELLKLSTQIQSAIRNCFIDKNGEVMNHLKQAKQRYLFNSKSEPKNAKLLESILIKIKRDP